MKNRRYKTFEIVHSVDYTDRGAVYMAHALLPNEEREIVKLYYQPSTETWIVSSNVQLTTAKFADSFESFGLAYKEYFKRIVAYLDYKYPDPFRLYT